ncbi:MAG TPA: cytochrome c peroxidase [Chitinophagales bacterium]|nr:cytochrome c peroxidase [Chitinophagales bacterium]
MTAAYLTKKQLNFWLPALLLWMSAGCAIDPDIPEPSYSVPIPEGFPAIPYPDDNFPDAGRIALGKELFFDPVLSIDSTVSCNNCHLTQWAFADHAPISAGVEGRLGFRNAPTLANVAWQPIMTMDGGSPTLEQQFYIPLEDFHEMAFNMVLLTDRLQADPYYTDRFYQVFEDLPSPFTITRAIAAYERTIISGNSKYDQVMRGIANFTPSEQIGYDLFFSDSLACSSCHSPPFFTNFEFLNNGLYETYYPDSGRARITVDPDDAGKFKVPTLRNIAWTWPYMHDGSLPDLATVIDHYQNGGSGHRNQDPRVHPLHLNDEQKQDLILFLNTLTDDDFLQQSD